MNGVKYCENFTGMVYNETISLSGIGFVNKYDFSQYMKVSLIMTKFEKVYDMSQYFTKCRLKSRQILLYRFCPSCFSSSL